VYSAFTIVGNIGRLVPLVNQPSSLGPLCSQPFRSRRLYGLLRCLVGSTSLQETCDASFRSTLIRCCESFLPLARSLAVGPVHGDRVFAYHVAVVVFCCFLCGCCDCCHVPLLVTVRLRVSLPVIFSSISSAVGSLGASSVDVVPNGTHRFLYFLFHVHFQVQGLKKQVDF
ncbi:hypothetical protein L9F63_005844, partial [Diploptera punctata]